MLDLAEISKDKKRKKGIPSITYRDECSADFLRKNKYKKHVVHLKWRHMTRA